MIARTHTQRRARRELPVWCLRSAQYRVHVACSPFETVSPRNLAEISAGPTATRNQNGRSNPRLRRPTLPTVTILFFRPFQIRKVEAVCKCEMDGTASFQTTGSQPLQESVRASCRRGDPVFLIPSSRDRHSVRASFSTATYTYYAHDGGVRILRHRRHRPIAAKVCRLPAAEVLQPGLPAGRVAGRPQGRVQAAPGGGLVLVRVLFAVSLGNVYFGKSRRGGRWRRRWSTPVPNPGFNPVSRYPAVGRLHESRFLLHVIAEHQKEDKEGQEQNQTRHHKRTRGQRRTEHRPRSPT